MVRLCTEPEDPSARTQSALEFDTGDRSAAALALACFWAVRRMTDDVDHEPLAGAHASRASAADHQTVCARRRRQLERLGDVTPTACGKRVAAATPRPEDASP